jgi:hypothetical protein
MFENNCLVEFSHLKLNLFLTDFEITEKYNVREDNMVIIDLVATMQGFGFSSSQNISECSFQKVGHDQRCVSNQQQTWSQCSSMKLAVQTFAEACIIQNKGLTLTGSLGKIICN